MNRKWYFTSLLMLNVLVAIASNDENELSTTMLISIIGHLIAMWYRLQNLCISRWWILSSIIPILNIYLIALLLLAPPGYGNTNRNQYQKTDSNLMIIIGWMIMGLLVSVIGILKLNNLI